ncbi:MAG: hypothetical protein ACO3NW_04610 [Kiritimatiellia bacterium]
MRWFFSFCVSAFLYGRLWGAGELETRVHTFEFATPELVEQQLRALIPQGPRVSMHPSENKVIVIADAETHARIDSMLKVLGRPPRRLRFRIQHNREVREFSVPDGIPLSLPVSSSPPERLLNLARSRLAPDLQNLPVVGSALQAHVIVLREDPAVLRLRITPAVVFGALPPYEVVDYPEWTTDLMISEENYLEIQEQMKDSDFYREFLKTQPDPAARARPVSLLISFAGFELEPVQESHED